MEKVDLKKELNQLCTASAKEVVQVDVPALRLLMIDGAGDPNQSPAYAQAVDLSDIRRAAASKWKTILRQPMT